MMLKRIKKLLYALGALKTYEHIDRMRYLRRLRKPDTGDWRYASADDAAQFVGGEVVVRWSGIPVPVLFYCDPDSLIERDIIKHGAFRPAILELLGWYARPGTLVLDIGANVGVYAVALASMGREVQIHCFEPNPDMADRLERNVRLNRVHDSVHIHAAAVSDVAGRATFHLVRRGSGNQGLSALRKEALGRTPSEPMDIDTITLDDTFLAQERAVSAIKIDVQGSELDVLTGARRLIERDRPVVVFEHEDALHPDAGVALARKRALGALFAALDYEVLYVSRRGTDLYTTVAWERALNGDLLALPLGPRPRRS
jgi:FkbM family methyltransferase